MKILVFRISQVADDLMFVIAGILAPNAPPPPPPQRQINNVCTFIVIFKIIRVVN